MLAAKANFEAELILPNNISRVYKCINSITRHDTIQQNLSLDSQMATSVISSLLSLYTATLQQFATSQYPSLMSTMY